MTETSVVYARRDAVATVTLNRRQALNSGFGAQPDAERDLQSALGRKHDHTEGVTAFLAKRARQFSGA